VVGNEKHRVVCKKHKKSKKSQALRMTIPWWGSKTLGRLQKDEKIEKVTSSQDDDSVWGSKTLGRLQKTRKDRKSHRLSG
jgi:hypothetical protein